jgi:nitrogen fixation/metabolism regulation signal transduction histidine kinase
MEIFFLWLASISILLAGYLGFLWWRSRQQHGKNTAESSRRSRLHSGRFQVRLTILFLFFALVPTVPLVLLVSSLYTRSMELLLVPKIEQSLSKSLEAIKFQLEDRARLFANAIHDTPITPEILAQWQIGFCLLLRYDGKAIQRVSVEGKDLDSRQRGLEFNIDQIREVWGQTGSQLHTVAGPGENSATALTIYCHAWLPRSENEMLVVGFPVDPFIITAKQEISEARRVYNSLALIKESLIEDKILWSAAALLIMLLSVFSVWAARRFSQNLSRPIELLTATMEEVAQGNLNVRAEIPAKDEIALLVDSFNQMIQDLRMNREKLIASERLAAWRDVARQVSHEIKNPLSSIQLALYRLRQRFPPGVSTANNEDEAPPSFSDLQKMVGESLQSIDDELAGLRHLAEEFSEFARLPQADLKPDNLNEVVQMTAQLHQAVGSNRIKIDLDLDPSLPLRPIDREQIKRLLNNLLKNAMEAMPNQRCEVRLRTRRHEEWAVLEIADNGPGLTPEARRRIFEPNFTTKREGGGLGLVIVKRIVEEHGGRIEVESETGKGTCFRVMI